MLAPILGKSLLVFNLSSLIMARDWTYRHPLIRYGAKEEGKSLSTRSQKTKILTKVLSHPPTPSLVFPHPFKRLPLLSPINGHLRVVYLTTPAPAILCFPEYLRAGPGYWVQYSATPYRHCIIYDGDRTSPGFGG